MRSLFLLALTVLTLSALGCPRRRAEAPPDYDATRRRAQESHDSMEK